MKRAIVFLLTVTVFSILVLAGCAAREQTTLENRVKSGGSGAISSRDVEPQGGVEPSKETGALPDRALIKTFSMTLRAEKVERVAKSAISIATRYGGYVQQENYGTESGGTITYEKGAEGAPAAGDIIQAYLELRIPSNRVEAAVEELKKLGTVDVFNRNVSDVTQSLTELTIRLDNKKAEAKRLEELFNRAGTVKDVLEVARELARVREEIQLIENELRSMKQQVDYATVALTIVKPAGIVEPGFEFDWKQLIRDFITQALYVIGAIFRIAGFLAPLVILALIVYVVWVLARRAVKK
jgi:hypothetical protein